MGVLPHYLLYIAGLEQTVLGLPTSDPAPLVFPDTGQLEYIVKYTAGEFREILDCVLFGAEYLYPEKTHQIAMNLLRPIEWPYDVTTGGNMDIVSVGAAINTAPYTNPQSLVAGWNTVNGWCAQILDDTTGEASINGDELYLPADDWAYQVTQVWNGASLLTASLQIVEQGGILGSHKGVGAYVASGIISAQGRVIIDTGEWIKLFVETQATGQHLGTVNAGSARFTRALFWRVTGAGSTPPVTSEYPVSRDLKASWPGDFAITHGTFQATSGLHADPYDANSDQARFTHQFGETFSLTRITIYYDSTNFPTSGLGQNIWSITARNGGSEQFEQLGTPQPNQTDGVMEWTGTATGVDEIYILLRHRSASGDAWITGIELDGEGTPPEW